MSENNEGPRRSKRRKRTDAADGLRKDQEPVHLKAEIDVVGDGVDPEEGGGLKRRKSGVSRRRRLNR